MVNCQYFKCSIRSEKLLFKIEELESDLLAI